MQKKGSEDAGSLRTILIVVVVIILIALFILFIQRTISGGIFKGL